jgi:ADP-ribose pyrophosphatase
MKIHHIHKLTDQPWLNLFVAEWEHNSHSGRWIFASRNEKPYAGHHGDAVVIVPILRNPGEPPRLVLIREFRVPVGEYIIGLPAGLIEKGETVEDSIRREMREETGFEVATIKRITQPLYSSSGLTDEAAMMAYVEVTGHEDTRPAPEGSEDIEVLLVDYEGITRLCDDRSLRMDVKAWMVLAMYQQLGKLE